ncbi:hypothetical protein [uncultured Bacteroides sp.]|uniref:hypothetical protein n=1 Tax=uncultured Bacteroides sp. TaxID=162156 RepID=UPI0020588E15|nr:hypothetical protein [uncultured Bacteroides sp.]DAT67840.1 MAG TPA: hypothetical protein [Caudoviricetes sp.]
MRKLFIMFVLVAVSLAAKAQVYDGITQPTKFRVFMPVTTSLEGNGSTVAPFVGYRADVAKWLSVTPVIQYNMNTEAVSLGAWLNVNYRQQVYLLARSTYNTKAKMFTETLSGTIKLPVGLMLDATWDNLYNGRKFLSGDRLQVLGGLDYGRFVFNAGYSMRALPGFVANIRFKVTQYNWLQLKYDEGAKAFITSVALQFNEL